MGIKNKIVPEYYFGEKGLVEIEFVEIIEMEQRYEVKW
jgi:hypothetical protein